MTTPPPEPETPQPGTGATPPDQPQQRPQPRYGQYAPGYGPTPAQPATPPVPGAPGYGPTPAQPGNAAPGYGPSQYGTPQYGQPPYGQPPQGAPGYGPPAYGPPVPPPAAPRPGIVPLRPLGLGDLYDGAFRAIRHNPQVMLGLPALLSLVTTALGALFGIAAWSQLGSFFDDLETLGTDPDVSSSASFTFSTGTDVTVGLVLLGVAYLVVALVVSVVTQGVVVAGVGQAVLGRRPTVREVWGLVRGRVAGLVGLSLLLGVAGLVALAVYLGLVVAAGTSSVGLAVVVGLFGGLALVLAGIWVAVRVALAAPTYVLERGTVRAALARGWRLTGGSFWRLFGIGLLTAVIVYLLSVVLQAPGTILSQVLVVSGDSLSSSTPPVAVLVVTALLGVVATTIATAFSGSVLALLYIDLRMRREGLDVTLAAAATTT